MNRKHCTNPPLTLINTTSTTATAVFDSSKLWTKLYSYDSSYTPIVLDVQFIDNGSTSTWKPWEKAWVAYTITTSIMTCANIHFIFHTDDNTLPSSKTLFDIRISRFTAQGCYSYIGTDSVAPEVSRHINSSHIGQSMNLGWMDAPFNFTFRYKDKSYTTYSEPINGGYIYDSGSTIVHEFCHALGMYHELQSPYGNTLQFNTAITYEYFERADGWDEDTVDTNVLSLLSTSTVDGSQFDPNSIMKYSLPACLLTNGVKNASVCNEFLGNLFGAYTSSNYTTEQGNYIQQYNNYLSDRDKEWLSKKYPMQSSLPASPPSTNTNTDTNTNTNSILILIGVVVGIIIITILLYRIR
jgi:hypothetical protein